MPPPVNTPPRILCVDDRVSSLEVRRAMLSQFGYDVLLASDPPSALAILAKVPVDLVILDYTFPGQMSGEVLARRIRAAAPGLPLIMLSGYPELPASVGEVVDALIMKGAGGPSELLNTVRSLLNNPSPQQRTQVHVMERSQAMMDESEELIQRLKEQQDNRRANSSRGLRDVGT